MNQGGVKFQQLDPSLYEHESGSHMEEQQLTQDAQQQDQSNLTESQSQ